MSDIVKTRNNPEVNKTLNSGQTDIHSGFKATGVSFQGYSGQNRQAEEQIREVGKSLAAMGSDSVQSEDTKNEAAALAAASLFPSYLVSQLKDKVNEEMERKHTLDKDKNENVRNREGHQSEIHASDHDSSTSHQNNFKQQADFCGQSTSADIDRTQRQDAIFKNREALKKHQTMEKQIKDRDNAHIQESSYAGKRSAAVKPAEQQWKQKMQGQNVSGGAADSQNVSGGAMDSETSWMQDAVKQNRASNEEIIKKCGIYQKSGHGETVRRPAQETEGFLADDIKADREREKEPMVCSEEERKKRKKNKEVKEREAKKRKRKADKDNRESGKSRSKSRRIKKAMVRRFVIQQGMDPESPEGESGIGGLIVQMIQYDTSRLFALVGKKIVSLFVIILSAILPVIISVAAVILPIVLIIFLLLHPVALFLGVFDDQEELVNNPKYVKTVVEAKYTDFYEDISDFANVPYMGGRHCNQVVYADGYKSNMGAVVAVYLSRICNDDDYSNLISEEQSDDIPYCLVDTAKEKRILKEVFNQFNYWEKEGITVAVQYGVYDPETQQTTIVTEQVPAEKMTVHTLSLRKWKDIYLESMTEDEKEMLKVLEEYADSFMNGTGNGNGGSDYGPITDIPIPEGANQNLIYMAAFIKAEAGGQPFQGKAAVGYVILNRAGGPDGNIIGVLTAPGQFSCYIPHHTVEPYIAEYAQMSPEQRNGDECWLAAVGTYTGALENPIGDIRYYCNPKGCSVGETAQWAKIRAKNGEGDIIIIGDHVFCRNCW